MVYLLVYVVGGGLAVTFFLISLAAMVAVLDIAVALRRISRTLERIELAFAQPPYDRPRRKLHHINMQDNAPATIWHTNGPHIRPAGDFTSTSKLSRSVSNAPRARNAESCL